jgi:tellurite resistance protein TehA-like permease
MAAISENHTSRSAAQWRDAAAGAAPVFLLALATTMEGTSTQVFPSVLLVYGYILLLFILPVIGILRAVEQGFPGWSLPYLGLAVLDALLLPLIMTGRLFENALGVLLLRSALVALLIYFVYGLLKRLRGAARKGPAVVHDWTQFLLSAHVLCQRQLDFPISDN